MATASRPESAGKIEIESADDFVLTSETILTGGTFTGLISAGATLGSIDSVDVEIYRVFPKDSQDPPSGNVPTRANSPSDVAFDSRGTATGSLAFTASLLNPNFTAANSVLNGIHPSPLQTTGGEGPVSGGEVLFTFTLTVPFDLPADHYFFIPQVELSGTDNFFWLSAPGPPLFTGDLQSWIRNADLDPDWLRVGTDVVGGASSPKFNASFSLTGTTVPEPSSLLLVASGIAGLVARRALRAKPV
jgi:PEP-CTERM motif